MSPSGDRKLTLQDFTAPIDAVVNWGDGTRDALTQNAPLSHTYADEKPRTVTISGQLGGFWNAATRAAGAVSVTSLDEVSSKSLVTLAETFRQCPALTTLPGTLDAPALANCDRAFYNCGSVTSGLPALWETHPAASHEQTFTGCALTFWGHVGKDCPFQQWPYDQTFYQRLGKKCSYKRSFGECSFRGFDCAGPDCTYTAPNQGLFIPCTKDGKNCSRGLPRYAERNPCPYPINETIYAEAQKAGWA